AEIVKEDADTLAVAGRTWRGGSIGFVQLAPARTGDFPPPVNPSARSIETDREQLFVVDGGEENPVANQHRRRVPGWQLGFPDNILVRSELDGEIAVVGNPGRVDAAKLRPVIGAEKGCSAQEQSGEWDQSCHQASNQKLYKKSRSPASGRGQILSTNSIHASRSRMSK